MRRLYVVLKHALAFGVHQTEAVLRICVTLFRRFVESLHGFLVVLRHALAVGVHHAEIVLRFRVTLFRRLQGQTMRSLIVTLFQTLLPHLPGHPP